VDNSFVPVQLEAEAEAETTNTIDGKEITKETVP